MTPFTVIGIHGVANQKRNTFVNHLDLRMNTSHFKASFAGTLLNSSRALGIQTVGHKSVSFGNISTNVSLDLRQTILGQV
jgi:hypothetical protein